MVRAATTRVRFTDDYINDLEFVPPDAGPDVTPRYYDTDCPSLMLRVSKTEKTFFLNFTDPNTHRPGRRVAKYLDDADDQGIEFERAGRFGSKLNIQLDDQ